MSLKGTAKQTLEFLEHGGYDHPQGARVEFGRELIPRIKAGALGPDLPRLSDERLRDLYLHLARVRVVGCGDYDLVARPEQDTPAS